MRMFRSLQFKLSAALFVVGAVLIILSTWRQYSRSVGQRMKDVTTLAFVEGSRLSGMAQHLLRRGASRAADLQMSYAAANPDLIAAVVVDARGVILHATQQQYKGLRLEDTPLAIHAVLARETQETMEGRVVELRDQLRTVAAFPFWEGLARDKGCVVAAYDLNQPLAVASARALNASVAQALALAGGCLILWLMLKLVVTERVAALVEQVHQISPDADPAPVLSGTDELSRVSDEIHTAHRRLQRSERRFRQIAAAMRDVFWLAPASRDQSPYANEAYRSVFGRDEKRLASHRWDWLRAIAKEDRRGCLRMLRDLRNGRSVQDVEVRVLTADGGLKWIRCRGSSLAEAYGPRSAAGTAMDVSERKLLERRLLDATEKERRRIGMDLHDDLCQRLAAALMKTGVLRSALNRTASASEALASELAADLADATGVARGFARGLAPVGIEALGLNAALSDLADFITRGFKVPCRVEYHASAAAMAGESATHVFRVAQELATNAAKHANPAWIEINFEMTTKQARLVVSHDGAAYLPDGASHNGMGMHMVRQRLDALGASLSFHANRPHGGCTQVECLISASRLSEPAIPESL